MLPDVKCKIVPVLYTPGLCVFTQTKERALKFEKFVAENEVKRSRALKKYEAAREQNILKQREIEDLTEQMKQLRARWGMWIKSGEDILTFCFFNLSIVIVISQTATFKRENDKIQDLWGLPDEDTRLSPQQCVQNLSHELYFSLATQWQ